MSLDTSSSPAHTDCFFDFQLNASKPKCVRLDAGLWQTLRQRAPRGPAAHREAAGEEAPLQWRVLAGAVRHTFEALPWKPWKLASQKRLWNASAASRARTLVPTAVLKRPCMQDGCDGRDPQGMGGHQCLPGGATLYTRDIVRAIKRAGVS